MGAKISSAKKMYGSIVKKQRDKDKRDLSQDELGKLVGLSRKLIYSIEHGKDPLTNKTRGKLAKNLEMPILAIFPPDIDSFSDLLKKRFNFEINSVDSFVTAYNKNKALSDEIDKIHHLYNNSVKNGDFNSRSLADRMLHTKIAFVNTNKSKRDEVFLQQISYIGFFELWIPHLEIAYLDDRQDTSNSCHEELFRACSEGNPKRIKAALKTHLATSIKDIDKIKDAILNF